MGCGKRQARRQNGRERPSRLRGSWRHKNVWYTPGALRTLVKLESRVAGSGGWSALV